MDKKQQLEQNNTETVKNSRKKYIISVSVIAFILAFVIVIGYAFSWFNPGAFNKADTDARATNFSAVMLRSFDITKAEYVELNSGTTLDRFIVKGGSSGTNATNVSVNTNLAVRYTGESSAYLKVQLHESWYYHASNIGSATIVPNESITFTLSDDWIYNEEDNSYYTKEPVSAYVENDEAAGTEGEYIMPTVDIPFIKGMTYNGNRSKYTYFNLVTVIESVQPDRYEEFGFNIPESAEDTST